MKKLLACCLFLSLLTACGTSQPTKFYTLSSVKDTNVKKISNKKITIGVDTVSVAGYLERPQIVTSAEGSEINMSEYNRWAEPLSYSVQRVVAENISSYLKNGMAKPLTFNRSSYDYIVNIELNKFDGKLGETVEIDAWWSINKGQTLVAREQSSFSIPVDNNYNDLVEKQSILLEQLSENIAQRIAKLK